MTNFNNTMGARVRQAQKTVAELADVVRAAGAIVDAPPDPREVAHAALWVQLLASMAPEHAALVLETREVRGEHLAPGWREASDRACRTPGYKLEYQCSRLVYEAVFQGSAIPVAMPPAVAQAYIDNPDALPLHDCGQCRYPVPVSRGVRLLTNCPVCGSGDVGFAHRKATD